MPEVIIIIIIIIIKICSAHISTLLGAQGAETEKTWIQTIYNDSKNDIMCRDTCTMQLQIYLWHKMSFKQRLKSGFTMTRFEFSWKMIPAAKRMHSSPMRACITYRLTDEIDRFFFWNEQKILNHKTIDLSWQNRMNAVNETLPNPKWNTFPAKLRHQTNYCTGALWVIWSVWLKS